MDDIARGQCGRLLRLWLRHKPEQAGLDLLTDGWAPLDDVVTALLAAEVVIDREELEWFVRSEPEHAFEIESDRIRARSGHSVDLGTPTHAGTPPATLYGAVPPRYADRTDIAGLAPRKRQYNHLFTDRSAARDAAVRRDQDPVLYRVAAQDAAEAGVAFYPRGEGVWLCGPLAPEFLTRMAPSNAWEDRSSRRRPKAPGERRRRPAGGFMKRPSGKDQA